MRHLYLGIAVASLLFFGSTGCDFTPDFHDLADAGPKIQPDPQSCGGDGILCTVAGIAREAGADGDGGPAVKARLNTPVDLAMAPFTLTQTGDLYVVDRLNNRIRKIDREGIITTVAITGPTGNGSGSLELNEPAGLTIGLDGIFYLAGWKSARVYKIDPGSLVVSDMFGTEPGLGGDGGPANQAQFDLPSSIAYDPDGNLYVSDQRNHRIRMIDTKGTIATLAGSDEGYADGQADTARFHFPSGSDPIPGGRLSMNTHDWVLYIADTENNRIRRYNFFTGVVTTVAGTGEAGYSGDGQSARMATLNGPTDVIFTEDHRMYIADTGNHVVREVDAFGTISTVVGTGAPGSSPDGTPAESAMLNGPAGIFFDEVNRTLYIADSFNHQIKRVRDPY